MLCKVAPQPNLAVVSVPISKFRPSFIFPKQEESIFEIKHEIFTVIINNEWLVISVVSTQNKNSVSNWAGFF